jgi:chromosome segregation ATPase
VPARSDIINRYPNVQAPTGGSTNTNPVKVSDNNFEIETLKREKEQLRLAFNQKRIKEAELKKRISSLEDRIRIVEGDNSTLQEYNRIFANENDRLTSELEELKKQLKETVRPVKRIAIEGHRSVPRERSPDESDASKARVRIFLMVNFKLILINDITFIT